MEPTLIATLKNFSTAHLSPRTADIWVTGYLTDPSVPALMVTDHDDPFPPETQLVATVNLAQSGVFPETGNVLIRDSEENDGVRAALEKGGVIGPALATHQSGWIAVTEHKLLKGFDDHHNDDHHNAP